MIGSRKHSTPRASHHSSDRFIDVEEFACASGLSVDEIVRNYSVLVGNSRKVPRFITDSWSRDGYGQVNSVLDSEWSTEEQDPVDPEATLILDSDEQNFGWAQETNDAPAEDGCMNHEADTRTSTDPAHSILESQRNPLFDSCDDEVLIDRIPDKPLAEPVFGVPEGDGTGGVSDRINEDCDADHTFEDPSDASTIAVTPATSLDKKHEMDARVECGRNHHSDQQATLMTDPLELLRVRLRNLGGQSMAGAGIRFWARWIDLGFAYLLLFTSYILAYVYMPVTPWSYEPPYLAAALFLMGLAALVLDAFIYTLFSNTPGKALAGIHVAHEKTGKLSFARYLIRNLNVWARGLGFLIPPLSLLMLFIQYRRVTRGEPASYDRHNGVHVQRHVSGFGNTLAMLVLVVGLSVVALVIWDSFGRAIAHQLALWLQSFRYPGLSL